MCVQGIGLVIDLSARGIEGSPRGLVHEVVPVSIEAGHGAMVDTHEQGLQRLLRKGWKCEAKAGKHNRNVNGDP
jgi:hypothetical protein